MVLAPRTLLIVDDSPEDREIYRRYLQKDPDYSYTILEASLGAQGLNLWQQHKPDIVILDYRLPDWDGLEFLLKLQTLVQQPFLPVIVVTGQGNEAIAVQSMKAGAQDYLIKGQITPNGLHLAVNGAIERVQLHTQLQQRIEQERLVAQITLQIHQSRHLEEILQTAVNEVRQFLQTDRVLIVNLQADGLGTVVTESVGSQWLPLLSTSYHDPCFSESYIEPFRQGLITVKPDIYDGSIAPCHVELLASLQVRANLVVPILQDNHLWGVLIAHHCTAVRAWQNTEIEFLQRLAVHLGVALQQAHAYNQLKHQSEARYRAIVEEQTDLIIRYLPDTTVIFANRAYCRYFNLQPKEIIGKSYEPVIFVEDREMVGRLIKSMNAENPTVTIENRVLVNGEIRWTQWINRMLFNQQGEFTEFQSVGRDITTLKEAEAQLRHSTERISLANAELARAARLKDEFLATMSHELRTPLNSILGLCEVLLEDIFGILNERQRRYLQIIEKSGQHLLALISDILDLSKIESGEVKVEIKAVSLHSVCKSSLSFVRQQAQNKHIQLTCEIDDTILEIPADERRLVQVLVNLLSNAVKFTPDGGQVKLTAQINYSQQAVELQVTDNGIGIPQEQLSQIFQPFIQLDSSLSRRYAGTGLGLPIVQRIVDLHGGSISVNSEVGQGSCFTILLPWYPPSPPENSVQEPKVPLASAVDELSKTESQLSGKILLAEDNEANITTLFNYLEARNFQIVLASNGLQAVQMAKQHQPDLIVMDIQMPEMDGLEATRRIRADCQTNSIPIIALTALAMPGDLERCLAAGVNDYLAKPVKLKHLVERIKQLLIQSS
ncbi:response regulator [Nostoc sp. FACHB-110]|uniref:response regulator n=1 Tax=Nostoc sp. FACHB-110 TaxID=2692834 RepID=UPI00168837F3|nr:response regulator [Nostoc sp. FACHB-110]MBD2438324.1 response regulator [Nostoc sp. FACHB-110]